MKDEDEDSGRIELARLEPWRPCAPCPPCPPCATLHDALAHRPWVVPSRDTQGAQGLAQGGDSAREPRV